MKWDLRISSPLIKATLHYISAYPNSLTSLCFSVGSDKLGFLQFLPCLDFLLQLEMSSAVESVLWRIVVISCSVAWASAGVPFSSLPNTLGVTATIYSTLTTLPIAAMAGRDQLVVSWLVNKSSSSSVDSEYKTVKVKLCFAPESQVDRHWRKTYDDLKKDKTCQFDITEQPYNSNFKRNTTTWTVERDVPRGIYFVRAYALNALGNEVAYGQSSNQNKTSNLFMVEPISGRHASLDIASVVFSSFAIVSLLGFFILEKWSVKKAAAQKK